MSRVILIHLSGDDASDASELLSRELRTETAWGHWVLFEDGDAYLCLDVYSDHVAEFEPDALAQLRRAFEGKLPFSIGVGIIGRHAGDSQVRALLALVLRRFHGYAQDDYTEHLWSLAEIEGGVEVQRHPFFDYLGWYYDEPHP